MLVLNEVIICVLLNLSSKSGKGNMADLICYCFEYTEADIRKDVIENKGCSTIMKKIAENKKNGACLCHIKHPHGK